MKSFAIGSLTLVANNVPATGFLLQTPIVGLDSPNYRTSMYARPGMDGGVVSSMFYDNRVVQLTGTIWANNPTDFETYRQQLINACTINKDANSFPIPTRVSFTTMANTPLYFDAFIDHPVMNYDNPNSAKFMINMTSVNPFLFSPANITSSNISPPGGGGYVLPVTFPIVSSPSTGGLVVVNNGGTVNMFPKLTLYGSLTNPTITNQTTGKSIQLTYTLAAGNTAIIDMFEHTITLNGSSSLNGTKTAASDWWNLAPGPNTIAVTSGSTSDTGYVVLSGNAPFLGI